MNILKQNIPWYLLCLLLVFCFKWFFMGNSINHLHWVLLPVTSFVELFTGLDFSFEENNGYINHLYDIIIDKNCSGINFIAMVFLMGALGFIHYCKNNKQKLLFILSIVLLGYLSSIFINSSRIIVSIQFLTIEQKLSEITQINFHKLMGILFYGLALFGIYALLEWYFRKK